MFIMEIIIAYSSSFSKNTATVGHCVNVTAGNGIVILLARVHNAVITCFILASENLKHYFVPNKFIHY